MGQDTRTLLTKGQYRNENAFSWFLAGETKRKSGKNEGEKIKMTSLEVYSATIQSQKNYPTIITQYGFFLSFSVEFHFKIQQP